MKPTTEKIFSYLMKNDEELKLPVLQSQSEGAMATKHLPLQITVTPPNVK